MRNFYLTLILTVCVFVVKAQTDTSAYRFQAMAIQKKFAPDKRAIYFNIQIKGDSVRLESTSQEALNEFEKVKPTMANIKFISTLLPAKSLNGLEYGVANLSVCNNRANPQNAAELMTQMLLGTPIRVMKKQGGFYLVKTPDGYLSWTDGGAIKLMDKQQYETWQKTDKIVFTADYGHGFSRADVNSQRVSDLVSGNILQLLGMEKVFYKVAYPDGRVAYLPKTNAKLYKQWITRPNPNATAILATAQTLLGVPYLWGGTSIKGVDCSGFTKTAYFLNGIVIPRDASQQALVGNEIDVLENDSISVEKCLKNLQPGDLLFFSAAKRRGINGGRVSHTAIYMGNGEFIQSAGMVKINSIVATAPNYDGVQSGTLVGARRILTEIGKPEITRVEQHDWYGKN
ncbi:glycoside hydrolase [Pedobacter frigiditerrae]|uniref:Glycoside hydrolase n=1 Tax=Pedobacter frigiditerrae TaxID=2530452 RepID=A0A4R0MYW4_9SPHI|nr:C40 family peptidase [Pedobacter frigiditerrae]TCC92137.1 glycoside hydrolase [Pedobacter frigiditerrae]